LAEEAADDEAVRDALLLWLAGSAAGTLLIDLEDLWLETLPQNVPGTSTGWPNWRRKLRYSLPAISERPDIDSLLSRIQRARGGTSVPRPVSAAFPGSSTVPTEARS
jgi:4-alpha-glucanotransferase